MHWADPSHEMSQVHWEVPLHRRLDSACWIAASKPSNAEDNCANSAQGAVDFCSMEAREPDIVNGCPSSSQIEQRYVVGSMRFKRLPRCAYRINVNWCVDVCIHECMHMYGCMGVWMYGCKTEWLDYCTIKWHDDRMVGYSTNGRVKSLHSVLSHSRSSISAWKRCLRVRSWQGGLSHSRLMLPRMERCDFHRVLLYFVADHHVTA